MVLSDVTYIIDRLLPEPHAGLLAGILFGTKETLPRDLYQQLITTGTLHIIALSGMNITIVSAIISNSLLRIVSRRITSLLTIVVIIGYILFVGPSPSAIRAAIMGTLTLMAVVTGRQSWSLLFLFLAGLVMLLFQPSWIADVSFQLSFLATLGIILFGGRKQIDKQTQQFSHAEIGWASEDLPKKTLKQVQGNIFRGLLFFIRDDLHLTLAAQVFTVPLILFAFQRVSLISPLTNVFIGWTIPIVTVLGFIAVFLGLIWEVLALPFAWTVWLILEYVLTIVRLTSFVPFASLKFGF